ncbi:unnamed protein product [Phytomonas sp. Hart1]|nr:unnamed protein product [Phytomonas sp. Hart1]|eukprot:CCW67788.1 unnamed protein product [Phytomonas sp. isolate Hart1]
MSLSFTISANFVRHFMSILSLACRNSDVVLFLPAEDALELISVPSDQTSHLRIAIHRAHLEGYQYLPTAEEDGGEGRGAGQPHLSQRAGLVLCVLSRSLRLTILHQNITLLQRIRVQYSETAPDRVPEEGDFDDPTSAQDARAGMLHWESTLSNGTVKTFSLSPAESRCPSCVSTDPTAYHFELSGSAKVVGGLLYNLSPTATKCVMVPLNGRLEIRRMVYTTDPIPEEDGRADEINAPWGSRRKGRGRGTTGGLPDEERGNGDPGSGGSSAVISAYPQAFNSFRYFDLRGDEARGRDSHPPSNPARAEPLFIPLPSKLVDTRPLQRAVYLAGQLGFLLQIRFGGIGCPIHVLASGGGGGSDSMGLQVSFDMYVAALDIALDITQPQLPLPTPRSTVGEKNPNDSRPTAVPSGPSSQGPIAASQIIAPTALYPSREDTKQVEESRVNDDPSQGNPCEPRNSFSTTNTPVARRDNVLATPTQAVGEDRDEPQQRRRRLSDLYPLDYGAFTSAQAAEEEKGFDDLFGEFLYKEEDDDVQRFLQNCTSMLSEDSTGERWSLC